MDGPRPPSLVAPSIWKAEVEPAPRKSDGKVGFSTGCGALRQGPRAGEHEKFSYTRSSLVRGEARRHDKVPDQGRGGELSESQTAKMPTEATPLRRQPVQQRSAKRVEQMLDASAALIDELGYDDLTTTLIAKRAGVAVGSLYQFFPDKRAVVQALTQRNLDRFMDKIAGRLAGEGPGHWWDV